jgi:hypothetical protein
VYLKPCCPVGNRGIKKQKMYKNKEKNKIRLQNRRIKNRKKKDEKWCLERRDP